MNSYEPGDLVLWTPGSIVMSWPPDLGSATLNDLSIMVSDGLTIAFVIDVDDHGMVVIAQGRLWWCYVSSVKSLLT